MSRFMLNFRHMAPAGSDRIDQARVSDQAVGDQLRLCLHILKQSFPQASGIDLLEKLALNPVLFSTTRQVKPEILGQRIENGAMVFVGPTAPSNPKPGTIWGNTLALTYMAYVNVPELQYQTWVGLAPINNMQLMLWGSTTDDLNVSQICSSKAFYRYGDIDDVLRQRPDYRLPAPYSHRALILAQRELPTMMFPISLVQEWSSSTSLGDSEKRVLLDAASLPPHSELDLQALLINENASRPDTWARLSFDQTEPPTQEHINQVKARLIAVLDLVVAVALDSVTVSIDEVSLGNVKIVIENDVERRIALASEWKLGVIYKSRGEAHTEANNLEHIGDVLRNIDASPNLTPADRSRLRLIALTHDTMKYRVNDRLTHDGENHHAYIAHEFLSRFSDDQAVLAVTLHHDTAYNAWSRLQRKPEDRLYVDRMNRLFRDLQQTNALDLFQWFYACDNDTGTKSDAPYRWFTEKLAEYRRSGSVS